MMSKNICTHISLIQPLLSQQYIPLATYYPSCNNDMQKFSRKSKLQQYTRLYGNYLPRYAYKTTKKWVTLTVATLWLRDGKRCERCERCLCKEFPTGVKSLVKHVIKGGIKKPFIQQLETKNCLHLWLFHPVSWCFTQFPGVSHCFLLNL